MEDPERRQERELFVMIFATSVGFDLQLNNMKMKGKKP